MRDNRSLRKKARLLFNLSTSSTSWKGKIHVRERGRVLVYIILVCILGLNEPAMVKLCIKDKGEK